MSAINERRIFAQFDSSRNLREIERGIHALRMKRMISYAKPCLPLRSRIRRKLKHISIEWIKFALFSGFVLFLIIMMTTMILDIEGATWDEFWKIIEHL